MKKQLELTIDQAKKMLGKDLIMDSLIRANFSETELSMSIIDRIDDLPAALAYNGKTQEQFDWETERDTDQQKADKEWEEICLALREGKELKMGDRWYYPWMKKPIAGSGSGFSSGDCRYDLVFSSVGARHSLDTAEKAIYAGKQFSSILTRRLSPKS